MSKLDDVQRSLTDFKDGLVAWRELTEVMFCVSKASNQKLYILARFLQRYNDKNQKEKYIFDDYLRFLESIKSDYKQKVKLLHNNYGNNNFFDHIDDSDKHMRMLQCFQSLNQTVKIQLIRIAWFVLHCELEGIDKNNRTSAFSEFYSLIQEIDKL